MRFVYIHGFNSGGKSRSGGLLSELAGTDVLRPEYDYSRTFGECLASLQAQITAGVEQGEPVCLMGSSLGGFYATQLRIPSVFHVIAWNPVTYPAVQLARFLGMNTRFSDGARWEFTREACLSYAQAPDQRVRAAGGPAPKVDIFLGDHDEVLDAGLARAFWQGHAAVHDIVSGHQIADYRPMAAVILEKPESCVRHRLESRDPQ